MQTPQIIARAKSAKTAPPKKNIENNASRVVTDVIVVLDKVSLIDMLNTSDNSNCLYLRKFSRTLSYTTTVSFIEYPAIVSMAATVAKLNSYCNKANKPTVLTISCDRAAIAPKLNCHSKRNQI